jgi:HK97 gp10 family phage protein
MHPDISINVDSDMVRMWISELPGVINAAIQRTIYKVTLLVERLGKQKSPVDTGRLRASISSDIHPMNATVSTHTNYAIYVHDGTRYMRGRPFMRQAADDVLPQVSEIAAAEVNAATQG